MTFFLNVLKFNHGLLNWQNFIGKLLNIENYIFQIGIKDGIIKSRFTRNEFHGSGTKVIEDIPEKYISVYKAVTMIQDLGNRVWQ